MWKPPAPLIIINRLLLKRIESAMTTPENSQPGDVRMRGFARRTTLAAALHWLDGQTNRLANEMTPLADACGRVLGEQIRSDANVPGFAKVDDGRLCAAGFGTEGASPYNLLPLAVVGDSMPGRPVRPGRWSGRDGANHDRRPQCPKGPTPCCRSNWSRSMASGSWLWPPCRRASTWGESAKTFAAGAVVFQPGRRLRPQDIGVLSSIGASRVAVVRRPRVRIVVTGNELLPAGSKPEGCRIADSNGPMLTALVERDGGLAINPGIVPDRPDAILEAMRAEADLVLVSGGSSVGQEDHAPAMLIEHGTLPIHGIAMRPSSPTGMGLLDGRVVVLLPGNPVSCLCAYDFFGGRAVRRLGGRPSDWPYRTVSLPLARKIVSTVGRDEYLRVRLVDGGVEPVAIGGSSVLSSTTRADGFVLIPSDTEGYPAGVAVAVFLYDP